MNEQINRMVCNLHECDIKEEEETALLKAITFFIESCKSQKRKQENEEPQIAMIKYTKIIQFATTQLLDCILLQHLTSKNIVSVILEYLDGHASAFCLSQFCIRMGCECACHLPDFSSSCTCKCHGDDAPVLGCKQLVCAEGCICCEGCMTSNPCTNHCGNKLCKHADPCHCCNKLVCGECAHFTRCENPEPCFTTICESCLDYCGACGNYLCLFCLYCNHDEGCPDDSDNEFEVSDSDVAPVMGNEVDEAIANVVGDETTDDEVNEHTENTNQNGNNDI